MHVVLRKLTKVTLASVSLSIAIAQPATAQSFFSTGANVISGVDQNWQVSTGSSAFVTTGFTGARLVVPTPWPQSNWISNLTSGTNNFAPWFTFRQTFSLAGFNAATAALSFRWGCDDVPNAVPFVPVFSLNGGAAQGSGTCGAYDINAGSVVNLTSGFLGGQNTIDFFVRGNGITDGMGLNVISFSAQPTVVTTPEPATLALVGASFLVLAAVRRRKA